MPLTTPPPNGDPAPILPALHAAQQRDGRLTPDALQTTATEHRMSVAELYRVASFYHFLRTDDHTPASSLPCLGPVCSLTGAGASDGDGIACPGLCDHPMARLDGQEFLSAIDDAAVFDLPHVVDSEESLYRNVRVPGVARLDTYRANGGYEQLLRVLRDGSSDSALDTLQASGLTGRGGAGFPLGAKWTAVRDAPGTDKYVVCNADEGEPGTFKDRPILHLNPHLLLESMAIAGYITGARTGIIYLRFEYPQAFDILTTAIAEAQEAGLLGTNISGGDFDFMVHVRRGAGSYVCGEETALLNSLEGQVPWPRERPPFPTTSGLWGRPTLINNVETLCNVPAILERGADWFNSLGLGDNAGTKAFSISGDVQRPGNYELPFGTTPYQLIFDHAGGPLPGRTLKAFTLGGVSGGLLNNDYLHMPLDNRVPQQQGFSLGAGGVIVLDDTACVVDFARTCMSFYEAESCGRCFPCRVGTVRLRERLDRLTGRAALSQDPKAEIDEISASMTTTSACGLGQSAPTVLRDLYRFFPDEVRAHLESRTCTAGVCPF